MCVAQAKENTSDFLSWQCEFAATEMSNIDTNARHDGTGKNERNASAVARVTPKMHLAAGAWRSVVISNLYFFSGWGSCWEARFVSGCRGDPEASLHAETSQERESLKTTH